MELKGTFSLTDTCRVSGIQAEKGKEFVFSIIFQSENELNGDTSLIASNVNSEKSESATKEKEKRRLSGHKKNINDNDKNEMWLGGNKVVALGVLGVLIGAFTAGFGFIVGMLIIGMRAVGGEVTATGHSNNDDKENKEKQIYLSCESFHDAELWVQAIDSQSKAFTENNLLYMPERIKLGFKRHAASPDVHLKEVEDWISSSRWRVQSVKEGLRLFQQSDDDSHSAISSYPFLRINIGMCCSTQQAFTAIMNLPPSCRTGSIRSIGIVEKINENTDVVHIILDRVFVFPTWSAPRDLCLKRFWKRNESDGGYTICLDSSFHFDCPLKPGHVRGDLHAVYLISSPKIGPLADDDDQAGCLVTFIAKMNPKGWIWNMSAFQDASLIKLMMHVVDIRDALDMDRFVEVHFEPTKERSVVQKVEGKKEEPPQATMGTVPPPVLSSEYYTDIDASTFRIRGLTYNDDKVKAASAPSMFKLIAIDVFDVPEPTFNVASHPRNRVHLALQRGDKTWVFVVNIMIPGPPFLCFVAYLEGDKSKIEEDTPFGRIAKPFFYGSDDEFRNNRFKLIPKIVDGNMIIKMAVKDTPTLLGNKLKQSYFKGENYFELDVDVGSSSVARNVVGLAIGYSKAIVVDMGFCLQVMNV
jgi:nitrate reductase NapE component